MDSRFKKNFIKGSAAATIGTVSSMIFHFISIMLLTRNMLKEDFGIYALILVITYLFSIIGGLGLEYTLVRYSATNSDGKKEGILFPIIVLRAIMLAIISAIFLLGGKFILNIFDSRLNSFIISLALLFIINSFRDLLFNYLQGKNLFKRFAIIQTSAAASRVLMIIIYLYLKKLSIESLIFIEIVTSIFPLIALLLSVPRSEFFNYRHSKEKYRELINFSFPLYMNNILTFSFDRISVFMVGALLNPISVASFDVASRIPESLKRIFASFTIVFFPGMSKLLSEGNREGAIKLMNKSLVIFSNVLAFTILISFLFSNQIIKILFSNNYMESSIGFALLMVNFYLRALSNIMGYSLVSAGYSAVPMKANLISSIISITGGLLLIPLFGFMGAIYSVLIMSIVAQFTYTYFLNKAELPAQSFEYLKPLLILIPIVIAILLFEVHALWIKLAFLLVFPAASAVLVDDLRNLILNKIIRGDIDRKYSVNKGLNLKVIMIDPLIGNDYAACLSSGLSDKGVDVDLIVPSNRKFSIEQNFNVLKWAPSKSKVSGGRGTKLLQYVWYLFKLLVHILKEEADIVHFQFFRTKIEILFFLLLSYTKAKLVFTAHNVLPHEMKPIDRWLFSLIYKHADEIIVHSNSIKTKLLDNFQIDQDKVNIIPHGNFDFYLPKENVSNSISRSSFGFEDDDRVLLFFGQIREYKGLDILINAFNIAAENDAKLRLLIGGKPVNESLKNKYLEMIECSPFNERVKHFLEFIPTEKVSDFFSACDILVLPYKNIDHSGVVHLACSFSKPMLASDVGDFRETIEQNKIGFVYSENTPAYLAGCISEIFNSSNNHLEKMGARGFELNKTKFSWDNIADLTIHLYNRNGITDGVCSEKYSC